MVRREDRAEPEPVLAESALDGPRFASVHDGANVRTLRANEVRVVVLETRDDRDLHVG
jgi:hypothetical protein